MPAAVKSLAVEEHDRADDLGDIIRAAVALSIRDLLGARLAVEGFPDVLELTFQVHQARVVHLTAAVQALGHCWHLVGVDAFIEMQPHPYLFERRGILSPVGVLPDGGVGMPAITET